MANGIPTDDGTITREEIEEAQEDEPTGPGPGGTGIPGAPRDQQPDTQPEPEPDDDDDDEPTGPGPGGTGIPGAPRDQQPTVPDDEPQQPTQPTDQPPQQPETEAEPTEAPQTEAEQRLDIVGGRTARTGVAGVDTRGTRTRAQERLEVVGTLGAQTGVAGIPAGVREVRRRREQIDQALEGIEATEPVTGEGVESRIRRQVAEEEGVPVEAVEIEELERTEEGFEAQVDIQTREERFLTEVTGDVGRQARAAEERLTEPFPTEEEFLPDLEDVEAVGTGLIGAGAVGVAAPEPVTSAAGVAGVAAGGAIIGGVAVARELDRPERFVPEIPVPERGFEREAEIEVPDRPQDFIPPEQQPVEAPVTEQPEIAVPDRPPQAEAPEIETPEPTQPDPTTIQAQELVRRGELEEEELERVITGEDILRREEVTQDEEERLQQIREELERRQEAARDTEFEEQRVQDRAEQQQQAEVEAVDEDLGERLEEFQRDFIAQQQPLAIVPGVRTDVDVDTAAIGAQNIGVRAETDVIQRLDTPTRLAPRFETQLVEEDVALEEPFGPEFATEEFFEQPRPAVPVSEFGISRRRFRPRLELDGVDPDPIEEEIGTFTREFEFERRDVAEVEEDIQMALEESEQ